MILRLWVRQKVTKLVWFWNGPVKDKLMVIALVIGVFGFLLTIPAELVAIIGFLSWTDVGWSIGGYIFTHTLSIFRFTPLFLLIWAPFFLLARYLPEPEPGLQDRLLDEFLRLKYDVKDIPPPSIWAIIDGLIPDPNSRTMAAALAVWWGAIRRHRGPFGVVAYDLMPVAKTIEKVFSTLGDCKATREFHKNTVLAAKGGDTPVFPTKYKGTPEEIVRTYLHHTPFYPLFDALVPYGFSIENRYEHTMLIASTGHGKSTLIENMVLDDAKNGYGVVVIDAKDERDPERNLFMRLSHRSELKGKLVVIDPDDGPGINLFDVATPEKDDVKGFFAIYNSYKYFFNDLLGKDLSSQMGDILLPLISLACVVEGANMYTLIDTLEGAPYLRPYLDRIPTVHRRFLEREVYPNKEYTRTKTSLRRRVYGFGGAGAFGAMFMAQKNNVNLSQWLREGKVVLVHASRRKLSGEFHSLFGRYFISETQRIAADRPIAAPPAFIYVDEAQKFFDSTSAEIIREMRSSRLGGLWATQDLAAIPTDVLSAMINNTAIRLFGGRGDQDARAIYTSFNSSPQELLSNIGKPGKFICWVNGEKVRLSVPELSPADMSESAYREFRRANRDMLHSPQAEPPEDSAPPPPTINSPRGGSDDVPLE